MARSIRCPHCGQVMKVSEQLAGKRVDCPACKKAFLAPKSLAVVVPERPAEPAPSPRVGPPPVAAQARVWYFHLDGRNDGPHTPEAIIEQIKTGRLDAHTLVWREGMGGWQPLREVQDFRGVFATPPPVSPTHLHKAHDHRGRDDQHEPRAHYSRSKAGRDLAIGIWVAGGLGLAAVVALLVVLNRNPDEPAHKPGQERRVHTSTEVTPTTTTVGTNGSPTPSPKKAQASREKLLAAVAADTEAAFRGAIEAHKKGKVDPIVTLIRRCKANAEKLAQRDWGIYKEEVDALAKRLNEAGDGIQTVMRDRVVGWGSDGVDEKKRAEILELNKYEWISNWQKIIADQIDRVKKKGLDF